MWLPVAVTGAELGKKEFVEARSPELDQALKRQRLPSADTLIPSDTRKSLFEISRYRPLTACVLFERLVTQLLTTSCNHYLYFNFCCMMLC